MKTAIVYYSKHHGNTRKLIDALGPEITAIDAAQVQQADLSAYDVVGFASGIYYSRFHKSVLAFARENLPEDKPVFFLYTCGTRKDSYTATIREAVAARHANVLGEYGCLGYDSFGPFKLIGGIAKGHPTAEELAAGQAFFAGLKG